MRRNSLLWPALLGLALIAGAAYFLRDEAGRIAGIDESDAQRLAVLVLVLVMAVASMIGRGTLAQSVRYALGWLALLLVIVAGYSFRDELGWGASRMLGELVPGMAASQSVEGASAVVVTRPLGGHFQVKATINDHSMRMLVDTGATTITLTPEDARAIGIDMSGLRYSVTVTTANGSTMAAPVVLDSVAVGPIERRRIAALVTQPGKLEKSLLGMSFLDTLQGYSVSGNKLTLNP